MLRLSLILVFSLFFTACGKKVAVTETKFVISGFAMAEPDAATNILMVSAFNPSTKQLLRTRLTTASRAFTLPNGTWIFYAHYWNSDEIQSAADLRCGIAKEELTGSEVAINLTLIKSTCYEEVFQKSSFVDSVAGVYQPLELHQCTSFGDPTIGCSSSAGTAQSFEIIFPNVALSSSGDMVFSFAGAPSSGCVLTSGGATTLTSLIPSGSAAAPVPFVVRTYTDTVCSTGLINHRFDNSLLSPDTASAKVYIYTTPSPDRTRIFVLSGAPLAVVQNPLQVPASSDYPIDLRDIVSGGTPPYTFTKSTSAATMSSIGILTPAATPETITVTVTDANSLTLNFSVSTQLHVTHTKFSSISVSNWLTNRASAAFRMFTTPGVFQIDGIDVPRFWNTSADKYLLIERGLTNYALHSSRLDLASWTTVAAAASTTTDPVANAGNISEIQKTTAATSYVYQSAAHPGTGNFVVSAFMKAGSSPYGVLTLTNNSTCRGLHVDLSSGTPTVLTASGCNTSIPAGSFGANNIGNGWWQVWLRFTSSMSSSVVKVYPSWGPNPSSEDISPGIGNTLRVFNVQLEQALYPTSPIDTASAAAARDVEYHQNTTIAPAIGTSAGTLVFDYHPLGTSSESVNFLSICSGANRVIELSRIGGGFVTMRLYESGGANDLVTSISQEQPINNRIVASIGSTNLRMAMRNQTTVTAGTRSYTTLSPDIMYLGRTCAGINNLSLGVRRLGYWNVEFHPIILQQMANGSN